MRIAQHLPALVWGCLLLGATATAAEDPAAVLAALAREQFADLTEVESRLCAAAATGGVLDVLAGRADGEPGEAADAAIRAAVLSWLCTHPRATALITHRGVSVDHARIVGALDLQYAKVVFPLSLRRSELAEGLDLHNAVLYELHLTGSRVGWINADQLRVERDLELSDDFVCAGDFRLHFAWIEGNLDLSGAKLQNPDGDALFGDGCRVDGDVLLCGGFEASRRVSLAGARVAGSLDGEHGRFLRPGDVALQLTGVRVGSDLLLKEAVVHGGVICHGAQIGGDLDADGARFQFPAGTAFRGYALEAGGDVRFVGATLAGDVILEAAEVGRDLNFADAHFAADESPVEVVLHALTAARRLRWTEVSCAEGVSVRLDLRSAVVGTLLDDPASWPPPTQLRLHGFEYAEIHDDAPFDAPSRIDWLRRQPPGRFRAQPYEQLAEILQKGGQTAAARQVLIAKETDRAARTRLTVGEWCWYHVFGPTIGFGYEPWRALALMLVEILLGSVIFQVGYWQGWMTPTKVVEHVFETPDVAPRLSPDYPKFNALVYSLDVFTPMTYLHQADYWMPNPMKGPLLPLGLLSVRAGDLLRIYMWLHVVAGWTLTSLLIAGLSGLVEHQG